MRVLSFFAALFLLMVTVSYARTYTIAVTPWASCEVLWVAQDKGFYEREGLQVELKHFSVIPDWVKAIKSGRYDYNYIWIPNALSFWFDESVPNVVLIGSASHEQGYSAIVAKKGMEGEALKGKKIGVEFDSMSNLYFLHSYLKSYGISVSDVRVVTLANDVLLKNFFHGRLDAISCVGDSIKKAVNEGNGVILTSSREYYRATIGAFWVPVDRFKSIPKKDIKKLWRVIFAAREWMFDPRNEEELMAIVAKRFSSVPELVHAYSSTENIKEYREAFLKEYLPSDCKRYNGELKIAFNEMMQLRKELGLSHNLTFEEISDMRAMMEVLEERGL